MKLLLDECVTRYLKADFAGHEVHTIDEAGFKGLKNGALLRAASGRYDVLVTVDKSLSFQQKISSLAIAVLLLRAKSNAYRDLKPLIHSALASLSTIQPDTVIQIGSGS